MSTLAVSDVVEGAGALTSVIDPQPHHFLENLEVIVRCMNEEADLTPQGVAGAVQQLTTAARNRIDVDRYVADHPQVDDERIEAPIFLTGLPRSGTTYFQYLFDQDPTLRMLRTWEGDRPVPPPALDPASVAERIETATRWRAQMREATGGKIDAMHLTDVDGPQECLAILDQTFVNPGLLWTMSIPGYLEFLQNGADLEEAYRHHGRVLRLLQVGAPPRRWALKWPCHLLALDAIAAVHPDARFVVTHRDPVQALASNCSLAGMLRAGTSSHATPDEVGRDMLDLIRRHVDGLVAFDAAQAPGESRLVHVDYYQLVDEPEVVMPPVFESLELEWTPQVDEAIRAWLAANPKGKRGTHEYSLEEFGLDRSAVTEAFATYIERFDVPTEGERM